MGYPDEDVLLNFGPSRIPSGIPFRLVPDRESVEKEINDSPHAKPNGNPATVEVSLGVNDS